MKKSQSFLRILAIVLSIIFVGLVIMLRGPFVAIDYGSTAYLVVDRVFILNNVPYIHTIVEWSYGMGMSVCGAGCESYFVSHDHGKTWQKTSSPPNGISYSPEYASPTFHIPVTSPLGYRVECVPSAPKTCYKISGAAIIEISQNGGLFWLIDHWCKLPVFPYISSDPSFKNVLINIIPYDLGIIDDVGGAHFVVVAMGNQGVLVKNPDGRWAGYGVYAGNPIYPAQPVDGLSWGSVLIVILPALAIGIFFRFLRDRIKSGHSAHEN